MLMRIIAQNVYSDVVVQRDPSATGEGSGEEKVRAEDQKWKPEAQ